MRAEVQLTNFTAGELSPRVVGRIDVSKYWNGCESMLNFVVQPQGGATRRPGTMLVNANKDQFNAARTIAFIFSDIQAYVLELGNLYARIYRNDGVVEVDGTPVEIATPWSTAELDMLDWTQSDDTLFVFHPGHYPQQITRSSDTAWSIGNVGFRDGPYLDPNPTATTLTLSRAAGGYPMPGDTVTVAASSIVGINAGPGSTGIGFQASDVGRMLRWKGQALWTWMFVSAVADTTHCTAIVQATMTNGAFGGVDGQAWAVNTFYPDFAIVSAGTPWSGTGSVSGTDFTVASTTAGAVAVGMTIFGGTPGAVQSATTIVSGSGTDWVVSVSQTVGSQALVGATFYQCASSGISAASGAGPSGTSQDIGDNTATWKYVTDAPTLASAAWALGKWSGGTGFPWCGAFWQQRLMLGGTDNQPNAIEGSVTGDYTNFAPTFADGTVADDNALSWTLDEVEENGVQWMSVAGSAQAMQLGIGTLGDEHIMQAATTSAALTPTSVQAYKETVYGSRANVKPERIGKSLLFANRPGQKLHEWTFTWQVNGYIGPDIAVLSEHLLRDGITRMAWQQSPLGVMWMIAGGALVGMTYLREQDVVGFHRHILGGQYFGGPPIVEDLCVIPSPDGSYDELWLTVKRTVNGNVFRSIEAMRPFFNGRLAEQSWYLDCALQSPLTYPTNGVTISGLTAIPTVDGPTAWGGIGQIDIGAVGSATLAAGQCFRFNGGVGIVLTVTGNTGTFQTIQPFSATGTTTTTGAWSLTAALFQVSGLAYLGGETVAIMGDGQYKGSVVVPGSGTVLLPFGISQATIGLPYASTIVTVPLEGAAKQGAGVPGKIKALDKLFVQFDASSGGEFGARSIDPVFDIVTDKLEAVPQPAVPDGSFQGAALFSGVRRVGPTAARDYEGRVIVTQNTPLPMTVLGIGVRLDQGDVGG